MHQLPDCRPSGRAALVALSSGVLALTLSGCSTKQPGDLWLPGARDTTNFTNRITDLWIGSWAAAMAVGVLVWGLMLWCIVAYRRKPGDTGLPEQIRYHVPLEIMYTVLPLMLIGVLYVYTVRDQSAILDTKKPAETHVTVVAKQWSWDFLYTDQQVYDTGIQTTLPTDGSPTNEDRQPTLYLPVNKNVEFKLQSRDVAHSFWIPAFLFKMDTIPSVTNTFQVTPTKVGTYRGKCAELCGEYHSEMLFRVKVVTQAEYDAHIAELKAKGQTGSLDVDLGRSDTPPGQGAVPFNNPSGSN